MELGLVVEGGEVDGGWEWVKLVVDGRGRRGCWKNLGPSGGGIYMDVETGIKGSEITACYRVSGEETELVPSATVKIEVEHQRRD